MAQGMAEVEMLVLCRLGMCVCRYGMIRDVMCYVFKRCYVLCMAPYCVSYHVLYHIMFLLMSDDCEHLQFHLLNTYHPPGTQTRQAPPGGRHSTAVAGVCSMSPQTRQSTTISRRHDPTMSPV